MVIASQAFTALIPLLLLVSALLPSGSSVRVSDGLVRRFGLAGDAATAVRRMFDQPEPGALGVLSVALLVVSGVSLTRRFQRMYTIAWRLEPGTGVRASASAALGLAVVVVEIAVMGLVRGAAQGLPFGWAVVAPGSVILSIGLWATIPWLLLDRRVAWRRLLPTGVLAGAASAVYGVATTLYMPPLMESYSERFGLFGVVLALVGWLLAVAVILVTTTVVAAELDRAPEAWARQVRRWLGVSGTTVTDRT